MTLHDLDVADGPVTLRVGGAEPFLFEVVNGSADVDDAHVPAVLRAFGGHADPIPATSEEPAA